jgi:hypothetical protein
LAQAKFKAFYETCFKNADEPDIEALLIFALGLKHQKVKKLAKVPWQLADNPHKEALINRSVTKRLLSQASLNS